MNKYEQKVRLHQTLLAERHQYMKTMLSHSNINSNYQESIKYYASMRKRFLDLAKEESQMTLQNQGDNFINKINSQYYNNSAPLARYKMFDKVQKIKSSILKDLIAILTPSKNSHSTELQQKYQQEAKDFANKSEKEQKEIVDIILSMLNEQMIKNIKTYIRNNLTRNNLAIDYTDLVNKIFIPYLRRALTEMLFSQQLVSELADINGAAAAGYLYESEYAKTLQTLYSNFNTFSAGSGNKLYDTVISFLKTSNKKGAINSLEKNLNNIDHKIEQLSVEHSFELNDLLDENSQQYIFNKISVFGVQNKIYDLDYNKADGFNFKKITSNTGLLAQFNSLNRHLYSLNYGLMRAAIFLSQFKNTTQVFGRLNVLYAQGTKTVWTTDLIRTILSKGRYLIFSYANKKTPDFTATIGTEQLLKI